MANVQEVRGGRIGRRVCGKEVTEWCRNKDARKRRGECARGEGGRIGRRACGKEVTEWCRNKDARKRSGDGAMGGAG